MQLSVTNIIAGLTVLQLLIFFIVFLTIKRGYKTNHLLLSGFLFSDALYLIGYLLFSLFNEIQLAGVHFLFIGTSFGFLVGPLIYLYTKSFVKDKFHLRIKETLHLVPFILYNLIYAFYFYFESSETKIQMLNSGNILPLSLGFRINFLMNLQVLIYIGLSLWLLYNYDKHLKSIYSTIHHLNLDWLKLGLYLFMFVWIIDFIHFLIRNTSGISSDISGLLTLITFTINFIFINIIIYKGLKQPQNFFKSVKELPLYRQKIAPISDEEMNTRIEKLQNYMSKDKPHLNVNLTLNELAQRLELDPPLLLQLIKKQKQQTFFDYINSYRIKDAKLILSDPSKRKMTTVEVLYGIGFDSKKVFKYMFKKYTGVYPGEYKKRYLPHRHTVQTG